MKKIYLPILAILMSLMLQNAHAQWSPQIAPSGTMDIYSVFAIDSNAVACSSLGTIPHSINGGGTWVSNLTVSGVYLNTVHTLEPTHWYSMGYNSTWFIKQGNPNGVSLSSGRPDSILALHFSTTGCATGVGLLGKTVTTCDSGLTWQTQLQATTNKLNSVWYADANIGIAVGNVGTIVRTTDGGVTWVPVGSPSIQHLMSVVFPTDNIGYISGTGGAILKTVNAGLSWTVLTSGVNNNLNGIFFVDSLRGFVVGTNGLIKNTIDGGVSWNVMSSGTIQMLNSVHFVSPTCGWAVGANGTILKYGVNTTGMATFIGDNDLQLYPNPSTGEFSVDYRLSEAASLFIINDLTGRTVYSEALIHDEGTEKISTDLRNGIYFWEIVSKDQTLAKGKVIIAK